MILFQPEAYPVNVFYSHPLFRHLEDIGQEKNDDRTTKACNKTSKSSGCPAKRPCSDGHFVVHRGMKYRINENDKHYQMILDVPGVKVSDIEIEMQDKNTLRISAERKMPKQPLVKYLQRFSVDGKIFNTSEVSAELEYGVLTISMLKKEPLEPIAIPITPSYPPKVESDKVKTIISMDLPGVKSSDLELALHEEIIFMRANRNYGDNVVSLRKKFALDGSNVDESKIQGYLCDGVLTVIAPVVDTEENSKDLNSNRVIHVTSPGLVHDTPDHQDDCVAETSTLQNADEMNKDKEASDSDNETKVETVSVETVDEKDEWIALSENKIEKQEWM